ncbi:alpha/beta hydrolase, partial [Enterococcus innesii]|uniref:alpha/beta hydrolase n=1 Tax=Enterococcus innesii TaxID=2839759 RepID=UPI003F85160B
MAFLQANIYSNVLEMEVMIDVILPQSTKKKIGTQSQSTGTDLPVLYLLHGMNGNHSVWQRRTSIERYAAEYQLAVIMPSTDLGWYTDTTYEMKYWTFIAEELPQICHELFPQLTQKREKTFAAGLSMGGYGAVKLGLRKPDQFAAVASLSGALALAERMDSLLQLRSQ